jgi:hypothetical protein
MSGILNILKVADMHLVKEMLFAALSVSAAHLGRSGVINVVVPMDELADTVPSMTASIVATAPLANRILKEELRVLSKPTRSRPKPTSASSRSAARPTTRTTTRKASRPSRRSGLRSSGEVEPSGSRSCQGATRPVGRGYFTHMLTNSVLGVVASSSESSLVCLKQSNEASCVVISSPRGVYPFELIWRFVGSTEPELEELVVYVGGVQEFALCSFGFLSRMRVA